MISWPAMRKMKAWPTISSVVKGLDMDVGWLLWGGSTVCLVEDRASVTMSKSSTPTALVECRASSTICRKSFCLWGQEKKRYIRATEGGWRTREETPGWSSWTTQEEQVLETGLFEMVRAWWPPEWPSGHQWGADECTREKMRLLPSLPLYRLREQQCDNLMHAMWDGESCLPYLSCVRCVSGVFKLSFCTCPQNSHTYVWI